jgi:hypothetical protein
VISCTIRYEIDPEQVGAFEAYAKAWIHLVTRLGGTHHGYHLPHEGPSDLAYCHFSFPSLAEYEAHRARMRADPDCARACDHARRTGCIRRYDRSFTRPVLAGAGVDELGL